MLGVGKKFLKSVRRQYPEEILYRASPLFQPDLLAAIEYALVRSWNGVKTAPASGGSRGYSGDSGGYSWDGRDDHNSSSDSDGGGDGGGGGGD